MLPVPLEIGHELDEARVAAQVIQARIFLKQWVARVPIQRRFPEPPEGELALVHESISTGNVVGGVMKMAETFPSFYGKLDFLLRLTPFAGCGKKHGLQAGKLTTLVVGIVSE